MCRCFLRHRIASSKLCRISLESRFSCTFSHVSVAYRLVVVDPAQKFFRVSVYVASVGCVGFMDAALQIISKLCVDVLTVL